MEIKSVAVLGAGSIGSYYLWGLNEKLKDNICILAEGERKTKLEKNGVVINDVRYHFNVKTPEEAKGVDLVIVCTKDSGLSSAIDMLERLVDDHTLVMAPVNGVTAEESIGKRIGMKNIVYSFMKINAERDVKEDGSHIKFNAETTVGLHIGEVDGNNDTERIKALTELFTGTGIHFQVCDDINKAIWQKFAINIGMNMIQSVLNVGMGVYEDSEYAKYLQKKLKEEVIAIAAKKGIDISNQSGKAASPTAARKGARYSMLKDLDNGNHTEIEIFAGAVIEMGKEVGVPTPYNDCLYNLIKTVEERNDGKFDYE